MSRERQGRGPESPRGAREPTLGGMSRAHQGATRAVDVVGADRSRAPVTLHAPR
jgi:hypothetical protein